MRRALLLLIIMTMVLAQGCVKTTVNLDKVSGQVSLDPSFVIAAVKGDVTLGDIVEPNDTLFFDELGLMKVMFSEDSIINYSMNDFYTSFPAGSYSELFDVPPTIDVVVDTILDLDPGTGIEIKEMSVISGHVDYTITSTCTFSTNITVVFPSVDDGGSPLTEVIPVAASQTVSGQIDITGVNADLTTDTNQPFNRIPMTFTITPAGTVSDGLGTVNVDVAMAEPDFDYIRGYLGQQTEGSPADTIETGLEEIFDKISGDFGLANPIIRINYLNSFGIPLRVVADVTGKNSSEEINLNRAPEDLLYPTSLTGPRTVEGTFVIDRTNSALPDLVSMLPEEIIFSGSATSNPDGNTGADNYIFGDSRFRADVEVEVPMDFWISNLQLKDTLDNFLKDDGGGDSPLDMLSDLELRMYIENGFPLGGNISLTLFDSVAGSELSSISTDNFFDPAAVDADGRVTEPTINSTVIVMTEEFMDDASVADKMLVSFTLFTTGNGSTDVKLYSDYNIVFKAGVAFKADIN